MSLRGPVALVSLYAYINPIITVVVDRGSRPRQPFGSFRGGREKAER